eukprot:TRINITY_DN14453_c0_g1_i12.p1 TRINITY_DN14453_c0_g1~~TRINITY_DN14453_c0_g1_i12.p1  ORF type:complete len:164 (+),score=20.58 TRINITY_DN14453_c0_g1_i12:71-562(+)
MSLARYEATLTMMVHMFLMFAPSPLTGMAIARKGHVFVMLVGCVAALVTVTLLWAGTSLICFVLALAFLGIAWNLLFVSGTAMLSSSYDPAEGSKVQAVTDFVVFSSAGTVSLLSLPIALGIGWQHTQIVGVILTLITVAVLLALMLKEARTASTLGENNAVS